MGQEGIFRRNNSRARTIAWSEAGCAIVERPHERLATAAIARGETPERAAEAATGGASAVIGFPIESGVFTDERMRWLRDQPREPFSNAEMRTLLREAEASATEEIRRGAWSGEALFSGSAVLRVRIDGRRAINPIGFPGRAVSLQARSIFLTDSSAAGFFSRVRERGDAAAAVPVLLDDAALRVLDPPGRAVVILLDRAVTSVCVLRDGALVRRSVVAFGQEGAVGKLARSFGIGHRDEAERLLTAASLGHLRGALRREIESALAPSFLQWASAVRGAVSPTTSKIEAPPRVFAVHTETLLPPFQRALHPRTFLRAMAPLRAETVTIVSLAEALGLPADADRIAVALAAFARAATVGQFFAA